MSNIINLIREAELAVSVSPEFTEAQKTQIENEVIELRHLLYPPKK
jgi:hypothetical protein